MAGSWMLFRVSPQLNYLRLTVQLAIIAQGIAARHARRQASSEHAHIYAQTFRLFGHFAKSVLESEGIKVDAQAKL